MMIFLNFDSKHSGKTTKLFELVKHLNKKKTYVITNNYEKKYWLQILPVNSININNRKLDANIFRGVNWIDNLIIDEHYSLNLESFLYNSIDLILNNKVENIIMSTTFNSKLDRKLSQEAFNSIVYTCYKYNIDLIINQKYRINNPQYTDDIAYNNKDIIDNHSLNMKPIETSKLILDLMVNDVYPKLSVEDLHDIEYVFHYGYNIDKLKNSEFYKHLKTVEII